MEFSPIDVAWESVHILRELSTKAFDELQRLGGKCPNRPDSAASARVRAALTKFASDSITGIIAVGAGAPPLRVGADNASKFGTVSRLVEAFKNDPRSGYSRLKLGVRKHQDWLYAKIEFEVGGLQLYEITIDDVMGWYARWSANGMRLASGYAFIDRIRALVRFGARTAEDKDCIRLSGALSASEFPTRGGRKPRRITAAQADAIRTLAHKKKLSSIALAQAFQFDLKLFYGQVIGEWLPLTEPGTPVLKSRTIVWRFGAPRTRNEKWLRGLEWSQIDDNYILRRTVDGEVVKIDLKRHPMIMAELKRIGKLPTSGPLVVWEKTGSPYTMAQYRGLWRTIATEVGVPKTVRNVCGKHRDERIGEDATPTEQEMCDKVRAVCDAVPAEIRESVVHEMVVDLMAGDVTLPELEKARPQYVRRHRAAFDNRFRDVSIDQPIGRTEGLRLIDTISSERGLWQP